MSKKNKKTKLKAYRLLWLCFGGLILGCVLPLASTLGLTEAPRALLFTMELIGAGALAYVFCLYLLRR